MNNEDARIMAEPLTDASCRFTVDRPVYPNSSFFFGTPERAEYSPLAKRLFAISGVSGVLISCETDARSLSLDSIKDLNCWASS